MKTLSLDLETYSSVDLGKSSVYRYVESPDFDILLLGYSADGGEVQVVDLAQGEQIPTEVIDALTDSPSGCGAMAIHCATSAMPRPMTPAWLI